MRLEEFLGNIVWEQTCASAAT